MANPQLFTGTPGRVIKRTDSENSEKAPAYAFGAEHALAQYASTGCLNSTFYATAEDQAQAILDLSKQVRPEFIAKAAVYCKDKGLMKDTPALLLAILSGQKQNDLVKAIFPKVVRGVKDMRNVAQIIRSGITGRKSFGSTMKHLMAKWLSERSPESLFKQSIGQSPSLADVIKMVHPRPGKPGQADFFGYMIGKCKNIAALPDNVKAFEAIKEAKGLGDRDIESIPFMMLTNLELGEKDWARLAGTMTWNQLRQNLNSLNKHGVFKDKALLRMVCEKLASPSEVERARVFPYQIFTSYMFTKELDHDIRGAIQDALDHSLANLPSFSDKKICIAVDVSGSMDSPITGYRKGATSKVSCAQVASLFAAAFIKKNKDTICVAFDSEIYLCQEVNRRDSVVTLAESFGFGGGGTNCSLPLQWLINEKQKVDLVVYLSDNESWIDAKTTTRHYAWEPERGGTGQMQLWNRYQSEVNPQAKLVCIDLAPNKTSQAHEREDILNVGGFSDSVFDIVELFSKNELSGAHWVGEIEKVNL